MDKSTIRNLVGAALLHVGLLAIAEPTVVVDQVSTGNPWTMLTVKYSLSGIDTDLDYKVGFDVTANGLNRGVTNAAVKLVEGGYTKVIDTMTLFGTATADPKATVRVALIAVKPKQGQEQTLGGVQLWENGPYWAECNVGADKPEDYGYYFWWGDTVGYKRNINSDGWVSVKDLTGFSFCSENCPTYVKENSQLLSEGYFDEKGNLMAGYDASTAHLGAPWRMPTDAEFAALANNCDTEWTMQNGVYGRLVKGRGTYASKKIFLPAAGYGTGPDLGVAGSNGYYWSCTAENSEGSGVAWCRHFNSHCFERYNDSRWYGLPVRPVREFTE